MTTEMFYAVFENFNDKRDEPPSPPAEEASVPIGEIGEIRSAAWTEGYLSGCQHSAGEAGSQTLTAKLLTSVHDLGSSTAEAVDAASLAVADLLVNTMISVTSETWSAGLLDRVRQVAERIKPALTVTPDFVLRDGAGTEQHFGNISDLSRALDTGSDGDDVTIRWHRGEARISRMAYLDELRNAIIPLTAGIPPAAGHTDQPGARNQT